VLLHGLAAAAMPGESIAAGERVDNFVLLDHQGRARELYYQSDASAVVILSYTNGTGDSNGCAVPEATLEVLAALEQSHPEARFWLLDPQNDRAAIRAGAAATTLTAPILEDPAQIISSALGIDRSGEVLVLDPGDWRIVYRGGIGPVPQVLAALASDTPPPPSDPAFPGCPIDYRPEDPAGASISYSATIAPLLEKHCAYCHVEGGIGPWAMTGYDMIRGFAPMIREVVRTRRMPPWHADPHIGRWQGDRALSAADTRTLVRWIEAGAPRGAGPDPLAELRPLASTWPLGEPDLVVEIPGFEVPATGVVDYQFPYVKNELDHGVWISAATVLPGDRRVVHHVLAGSVEGEIPPSDTDSVMDNYIIGYAPGAESFVMPPGTGVYVAPGGYFTFQMHYTPIGRMVVDHSKLGLYLSATPPDNFLRHAVVISPDLNIPAHAPDHEEAAYYAFHDEVVIHSLFPHSHYRGRSSTFEVRYPDGRLETVLSVPDYDFNWQRSYNPVEPLRLPAGSWLIHRTVYDNSARNPANPDPQQTVHWGLQSWEEMLYGAFSYSWANETTSAPVHDRMRSVYTQFVGFLDRNMDGKVGWRELPENLRKRLVQGFKAVDSNGDGGLDVDEFLALQRQREAAEAAQAGRTGD
jgi:hypothetical protein